MNLFDRYKRQDIESKLTTKNFNIGVPEAEGEISSSKILLEEIFEDYLNIIPELKYEKFIITGRKGSGKTAIGETIYNESTKHYNYFCEFIRQNEINIQKIVQLGEDSDSHITQELIVEWIILIKMVNLILKNENLLHKKEVNDLSIFLKKNSGFVDLKEDQIIEIIQQKQWNLDVNYFKRFLYARFGNKFDIRKEKAPFYKLIPHLKETILSLLKDCEDPDNQYILIFDDLDIGFKATNDTSIDIIKKLIRITKYYNLSFFSKNNINAKLIILLRSDISKVVINSDADTAKIFSSYEIPIDWYEYKALRYDEDNSKLKRFINRRISKNFQINRIKFDSLYPWESLVYEDPEYINTSFNYVITHTFNRPRDLILFFKPISKLELEIPISKHDIEKLLGKYSAAVYNEISNELFMHFDLDEVKYIFHSLSSFKYRIPFSYNDFLKELESYSFKKPVEAIAEILFEYSVIGNLYKKGTTNIPVFKHWEKNNETLSLDINKELTMPFIIQIYLKNNKRAIDCT